MKKYWLLYLLYTLIGAFSLSASAQDDASLNRKMESTRSMKLDSNYPWKKNIVTTYFWIGPNKNSYTSTVNYDSAWDTRWHENYGGTDDPKARAGFRPKKFVPSLNPFYVALPFNDLAFQAKAKKFIPWYKRDFISRMTSVCKGKWIAVHNRGRFCFGTWEDVGPFRVDNAEYVFGNALPNSPTGAGLDVSPAIRDYLKLSGKDRCDWRFVEANEVPYGPWIKYGEIALVQTLIREAKKSGKKLPAGAKDYHPEG